MLDVYRDFAENVAAVPVYAGVKSASERFPGAVETFSIEALMPDGRALQSGDLARLGPELCARVRDHVSPMPIKQIKYAYTTSWGMSWRMLGGMIMTHGDDRGTAGSAENGAVRGGLRADRPVERRARGLRLSRGGRPSWQKPVSECGSMPATQQPGWKYSEWDLRGVPVRIDIGPRDVDAGTCRPGAARPRKRRSCAKVERRDWKSSRRALRATLDDMQRSLYEQAKAFLISHAVRPPSRPEFLRSCARNAPG